MHTEKQHLRRGFNFTREINKTVCKYFQILRWHNATLPTSSNRLRHQCHVNNGILHSKIFFFDKIIIFNNLSAGCRSSRSAFFPASTKVRFVVIFSLLLVLFQKNRGPLYLAMQNHFLKLKQPEHNAHHMIDKTFPFIKQKTKLKYLDWLIKYNTFSDPTPNWSKFGLITKISKRWPGSIFQRKTAQISIFILFENTSHLTWSLYSNKNNYL